MGITGYIIFHIIISFLLLRLIRRCNKSLNVTGWETKGHEGLVLFALLFPLVNIILLVTMWFDVFILKNSSFSEILNKFFRGK